MTIFFTIMTIFLPTDIPLVMTSIYLIGNDQFFTNGFFISNDKKKKIINKHSLVMTSILPTDIPLVIIWRSPMNMSLVKVLPLVY